MEIKAPYSFGIFMVSDGKSTSTIPSKWTVKPIKFDKKEKKDDKKGKVKFSGSLSFEQSKNQSEQLTYCADQIEKWKKYNEYVKKQILELIKKIFQQKYDLDNLIDSSVPVNKESLDSSNSETSVEESSSQENSESEEEESEEEESQEETDNSGESGDSGDDEDEENDEDEIESEEDEEEEDEEVEEEEEEEKKKPAPKKRKTPAASNAKKSKKPKLDVSVKAERIRQTINKDLKDLKKKITAFSIIYRKSESTLRDLSHRTTMLDRSRRTHLQHLNTEALRQNFCDPNLNVLTPMITTPRQIEYVAASSGNTTKGGKKTSKTKKKK